MALTEEERRHAIFAALMDRCNQLKIRFQTDDPIFTYDGQFFTHEKPDGTEDIYSIDIAKLLTQDAPFYSFSLQDSGLTLEKHRAFTPCDEQYCGGCDLDEPVLFVPMDDGSEMCIDGHHRMRAALLFKIDLIYCKCLTPEQKALALVCSFPGEKGEVATAVYA